MVRKMSVDEACAWMGEHGFGSLVEVVEATGEVRVREEWSCCRCGGKGHLGRGTGSYAPFATCFRCGNDPERRSGVRRTPVVEWVRKSIAAIARRDRAAAKRVAAAVDRETRMLDGQRDWCEKNGYGRVTFEERDAAREAARKEAAATKAHVGSIGERGEHAVTVRYVTSWDGTFGTTYCYAMDDAAGNTLVWKTGTHGCFEKGDKATIKATIKKHANYRGEPQTEVSRVKVVSKNNSACPRCPGPDMGACVGCGALESAVA